MRLRCAKLCVLWLCMASALCVLAGCGLAEKYDRELVLEGRSDGKGVVRYVIVRKADAVGQNLQNTRNGNADAAYDAWLAQRRNAPSLLVPHVDAPSYDFKSAGSETQPYRGDGL